MRPLRVGIQLPEVERDVPWPEFARMARLAEDRGFDSIWVGDHLLYRNDGGTERGPLEAWTVLAGLAVITSKIKMGPLVACVGFHPPAVLAKMAATVDEMSEGRLILGLGAGWNFPDFEAFSIPFDNRVSRFEEAFAIMRPLLAGERVTFEGKYWQAGDAVLLPSPQHHIPLMVGSNGERMLAITLPHADVWNTWYDDYGNTVEGFDSLNSSITEAALKVGRDPGDVERSTCVLVALDGAGNDRPYDKEAPPLEGHPEKIAAHLRALSEAGADEAILVVNPITEPSISALGAVLELLDA